MKVASKVAAGSGLLLALFAGAMIYQLLLVRDLANAHRDVATSKIRAAKIVLDELSRLDQIEKSVQRLYVTQDLKFADLIDQLRGKSEGALTDLESLELPGEEGAAVNRLTEAWQRLPPTPRAPADLSLVTPIGQLTAQSETLLAAIEATIDQQASHSVSASQTAGRFAVFVVITALLFSLLVVRLTVRSIEEPLGRLTAGTRAVAEGQFDLELDTSKGDEFAELAADFNAMAHRLGELDEVKKDLLSHVSHELKTPLATLQETHKLLLEEIPGELNAQQRRLLELNLKSSERLSRLISKLLDLSRHEAGVVSYDFAPRQIASLVDDVVAELEPRASERQIRLITRLPQSSLPESPLQLRCDGDRLMQVLENLVENAIKFAPEDSEIEITVRAVAAPPPSLPSGTLPSAMYGRDGNAGAILITVSDSGPGIPDAEKTKIFEKFHQAGPRRGGSVGGAGLGLAICRGIVEAHQGALWVTDRSSPSSPSAQVSGSTFRLLLPTSGPRSRENPDK